MNAATTSQLPYIQAPQGELPVALRELQVTSRVCGLYAETTQTMCFHNPNQRPLEGSLVFPLPEGAVVSGFALDIEGQLVDGVVVPKQEARRILEAEVRKGVDPGLIEQVEGNLYRTRIYPLPALGERWVRLTYVSELSVDSGAAAYHVALGHGRELPGVDLEIEVQSPVRPELEAFSLESEARVWRGKRRLEGGRDLFLRLPDLPDEFTVVEEFDAQESFFCISMARPEAGARIWQPARLGVVWDASLSRQPAPRELELLRELGRHWPACSVELVVARDVIEAPQALASLGEAADILHDLPFDGASSLGNLDLSGTGVEAWLLFSDGRATLIEGLPRLGLAPVFTLSSQSVQQSAWLNYVAQASGGRSLNLARSGNERIVELLAAGPEASVDAHFEGGRDVHIVRTPGRLQLLGRLTADAPRLRASLGGRWIELERGQGQPGRLLAHAWAARQSLLLQVEPEREAQLLELGRRYGLVTPGTSLLVLESLEQYLEYDIEPPASLPHLQEAFLVRRRTQARDEQFLEEQRLNRVAELWKARKEWWETDFRPRWESLDSPSKLKEASGQPRLLMSRSVVDFAESLPQDCEVDYAAPPPAPAPACAEPVFDLPEIEMEAASPPEGQAMEREEAPPEASRTAPPEAIASIRIQPWDPETPYLTSMRASSDAYRTYLEMRQSWSESPAFYLDCSDYFLKHGQRAEGLRVLSNLSELSLGEPTLMRVQAWRLQQAGELDLAVTILEAVLKLRPDEPQSHRDLALALVDRYELRGHHEDGQRAAERLYEVVRRHWDRFPEIEIIALMELNRLLDVAGRRGDHFEFGMDERLRASLDLDLRISLAWDADLTDVDLHVYEPSGEHASYSNQNTRIGGLVSRDFRQGYGPEEYVLRRAFPGGYRISAHYFGSHQQTLTGACTVLATVFTNYGRASEERQYLTLRLDTPHQEVVVGEIEWKAAR